MSWVMSLTELVNGDLWRRKPLDRSALNFVSSTNGKASFCANVRRTQCILNVVDFSSHLLICLLIDWQVLV